MSESIGSGFKRIASDRFSRKLIIMVVVLIFGVIIYTLFFSGGSTVKNPSVLHGAPETNSVQGTSPNSPEYDKNLDIDNQKRYDQSKANGTDSLPTIVKPNTSSLPSSLDLPPQTPAQVYRPDMVPPPVPVVPVTNANGFPSAIQQQQQNGSQNTTSTIDQNAIENYENEMRDILANSSKSPIATTIQYKTASTETNSIDQQNEFNDQSSMKTDNSVSKSDASDSKASVDASTKNSKFPVPVAGTILYSQLIGGINSDDPGPVIADILEGPYAGARLLGSFQAETDGVIIEFTSMTVPYKGDDGSDQAEVVPIKAVAVDTSQLGTSLATSVNDHLLARVAIAFATSFLQGFGQAISQSGSTTVVNSTTGSAITSNPLRNTSSELYQAGGTASGEVGQIINQHYANMKTTIKVASGTPFGLLFMGTN
jgi:intracellular multiplication protein IcmE